MKRTLATILATAVMFSASVAAQQKPRVNRVIDQLERGQTVIGTQVRNPQVGSLAFARALAETDLHFGSFDMKTGLFDVARLQRALLGLIDKRGMLETGRFQSQVTPFARVPLAPHDHPDFVVGQMLDIGVAGFVFPEIENRQQAEVAIRSMRYPHRDGYHSIQLHPSAAAAAWYWGVSEAEYKKRADVWPLNPEGELFAMLQIETAEGLRNLDDILQVPGVGAILIGPNTLSESLGEEGGLPREGGLSNFPPRVEAAIQTILRGCLERDVPCAIPVMGPTREATREEQQRREQEGFRVIYLVNNIVQ